MTLADNAVRIVVIVALAALGVYAMLSENASAATILPMVIGGFLTIVGYEFQGTSSSPASSTTTNTSSSNVKVNQ